MKPPTKSIIKIFGIGTTIFLLIGRSVSYIVDELAVLQATPDVKVNLIAQIQPCP